MDHSPPPWLRRVINAIPPMSDGVWLGFMLLMVFLLGMAAGMLWCTQTQPTNIQRLSVQHHLDSLDRRLKAMESR